MNPNNGFNRKVQIFDTAARLFNELGYHGTSMRQLAKEVGIETASIYSHINSKDDLLTTICDKMATFFITAIEGIKEMNIRADEKLRKAITTHIKVITDHINAAPVFFHNWRHLPEPEQNRFRILQHDYENIFRLIIQEGIQNGIFKPGNEKFIVLILFSALNRTHEWYKPEGSMDAEEIGNGLADLLIYGIKK